MDNDLKVVGDEGHHSESKAMWEVAIVMSENLGTPREGTQVGGSMLKRKRLTFARDCVIKVPLASALCQCTSCVGVPGRAMGVEVSYEAIIKVER